MFSEQHIIKLIEQDKFSIQELLKKAGIEDSCEVLLFCNVVAKMINDKTLIKEGNIIMNSDKLQSPIKSLKSSVFIKSAKELSSEQRFFILNSAESPSVLGNKLNISPKVVSKIRYDQKERKEIIEKIKQTGTLDTFEKENHSIPASPETEWLSAREMALKYGVSETTVYYWYKKGKIGKTEGKRNCYYYVKKPKETETKNNKQKVQIEKSETKEYFKMTIFVENAKIVSEILSKLKENEKVTIEKCQL